MKQEQIKAEEFGSLVKVGKLSQDRFSKICTAITLLNNNHWEPLYNDQELCKGLRDIANDLMEKHRLEKGAKEILALFALARSFDPKNARQEWSSEVTQLCNGTITTPEGDVEQPRFRLGRFVVGRLKTYLGKEEKKEDLIVVVGMKYNPKVQGIKAPLNQLVDKATPESNRHGASQARERALEDYGRHLATSIGIKEKEPIAILVVSNSKNIQGKLYIFDMLLGHPISTNPKEITDNPELIQSIEQQVGASLPGAPIKQIASVNGGNRRYQRK